MSAELRFAGVSFSHRGAPAPTVHDLELVVGAGEMVAMLGASGSGKSTALRLAAGLEEPSSGEVLIDGIDQRGISPQRRGIAMVFQKPLLFPHLSVIDNVAFADRVAGQSKAASRLAARDYLELVHLGDLAQRRARELSGGQEQRVALARALAARPGILLLDEPFGALDTAVREALYDVLRQIREQLNPTIVLVTHDLNEAGLADRVAVLDGGSITAVGDLSSLYAAPADLQVARLLGGFTEIDGQVVDRMHHSAAGVIALPGGCDVADGPALLLVHRQGVHVESTAPLGAVAALRTTADHRRPGALAGEVVGVRAAGVRQRLSIQLCADPAAKPSSPADGSLAESTIARSTVEAEVDARADNSGFVPGTPVLVRPGLPGTWVVPAPSELAPSRPQP